MKLSGAELIFCNLSEVAEKMDGAMNELRKQGATPYYIWGGGHSVYGTKAFVDAANDFEDQNPNWIPDFVIVPSGTGGTQAGLHVGFALVSPKAEVLGISVAREKERGQKAVQDAVDEVIQHCNIDAPTITSPVFLDHWRGEGHVKIYPRLMDVMSYAAEKGLLTDTTYTGKALCAMYDMVQNGTIRSSSRVLFWHTGGL